MATFGPQKATTSSTASSVKGTFATSEEEMISLIQQFSIPMKHEPQQNEAAYSALLNAIGDDCRVVMIGEASHGTHEFYAHRAEITKRLIREKGFNMVCLEADFPDTTRVNKYVKFNSQMQIEKESKHLDKSAEKALAEFKRFPRWMWRNRVMVDFVEWLKQYNISHVSSLLGDNTTGSGQNQQQQWGQMDYKQVGVYGLDLYSLQASRHAVIEYLKSVDPKLAKEAQRNYSCFDKFHSCDVRDEEHDEKHLECFESSQYAMAASGRSSYLSTCENEVLQVLTSVNAKARQAILDWKEDGTQSNAILFEKLFLAKMNAKIVKDAEEYYRKMFSRGHTTWNIRDTHMFEMLRDLMGHQESMFPQAPAKAVVWAHNSHLGDARATQVGKEGELNIGQLVRQYYGLGKSFDIGFSTSTGTVTAAKEWDDPPFHFKVQKPLAGSWENIFHKSVTRQTKDFCLILRDNTKPSKSQLASGSSSGWIPSWLKLGGTQQQPETDDYGRMLQLMNKNDLLSRFIGVVYAPRTERWSHYYACNLPNQFDAVIHFEHSTGVVPLEEGPQWCPADQSHHTQDYEDTYPFGL